MVPSPATLPGLSLIAGRYDVGEVLASGGVGTVHTGFDRLAQRPVAYKRLLPASESARPRLTALFRREYDTLTHLTHPNIVEAYDYGFDASGPYYTMELLSGSDLTKLAPLPYRHACRVLRDVASALALIHARRFVHRDVSPNNVRLTAEGRAKLIDFGGLSPFGVPSEIVGTPAFTAPESLAGAALDGRTDLYALGALAYWTLTRRTHVRARSLEELSYAWEDEILPPSHHVPELPKALDELVMALLQYDPVARPSHAADVIERLTAIAELEVEDDEQRVAFSYLQHAPQLGREDTMELLDRGLRAAMAGTGQMVLLEAEQGMGRSSLLHELAVNAQLAGATVLRVESGLHTTPFAAARHLVDTGFGIFPDLRQRARARTSRPARLPEREGKGPRTALDAAEQQALLATLLQDDIVQLSGRTPLVLLIDDAHTIDAESLALFASMAESLSTSAIFMVLTIQSGQTAHNPDAQVKIEATAQRCRLTPLSEAQLLELVTTMFGAVQNSQHLATWLFEQTGGNPGHSIDLARLLLTRGAIRYAVGTFTLPREFEQDFAIARHGEAALATIAGLRAEARELAYLAAIHSGPLTGEQLGIASGLSTRDVVLDCEQLVQRGVLVATDESVSCASASLRGALVGSRDEQQRREAHLALARALAATMQTVEDRVACARHLLEAGGEHAFEGACLLARVEDGHKLDLACSRPTLPLLERALGVLDARGVPDSECLGLLIPLSFAGFYGQLDVQYRYLSRTMDALALLLGVALAQRLRRYLGTGLALFVGMLVGWLRFTFSKRSLNRRTFVQLFTNYGAIPSSASAASACAWDVPETYRIAHMLDPFEAATKRSPMYLMRKFCLATADLLSVKMKAASDAYAELYRVFQGKIVGFDELSLEQFRCGCLHGRAQALVTDAAPEALALADELERRQAFFAPHAAGIRMTYHLYRGEFHKALPHRARAEELALRGGTSWSAMSVLTLRMVQGFATVGDVVGLMHVVADLERIAKIASSVEAMYVLAKAHLDLIRGQPEQAIAVYERMLETPAARALPSYAIERGMHIQALCVLGRFQEARALALALEDHVAKSGSDGDSMWILTRLRLASAEAGLGNLARAAELIESCFPRAARHGSPLAQGGVHRERALVAAMARDIDAYHHHLAATAEYFTATENPWLIQQLHALRAQGIALGMGPGLAGDVIGVNCELGGATAVETVIESGRSRTGGEAQKVRVTSN